MSLFTDTNTPTLTDQTKQTGREGREEEKRLSCSTYIRTHYLARLNLKNVFFYLASLVYFSSLLFSSTRARGFKWRGSKNMNTEAGNGPTIPFKCIQPPMTPIYGFFSLLDSKSSRYFGQQIGRIRIIDPKRVEQQHLVAKSKQTQYRKWSLSRVEKTMFLLCLLLACLADLTDLLTGQKYSSRTHKVSHGAELDKMYKSAAAAAATTSTSYVRRVI